MKSINEKWGRDKNPAGVSGEATYKKPLEINDRTDVTIKEILDELEREGNTDTIEETE